MKIKSITTYTFVTCICHEVMGLYVMILVYNVDFQASFITLLFHLHQEGFQFLFTFGHLSGIICISEVVDISPMQLVIYPALAFYMMYSAYKLDKYGDHRQLITRPLYNT